MTPAAVYLSERQLAARWGVGRSTVQRLRERGKLAFFSPSPGRVLYHVATVEAYERDLTTDAVTTTLDRRTRRA